MQGLRRVLLFGLAILPVAITTAFFAPASAGVTTPPRLGSAVFRWGEMPLTPSATGGRRDVANQPTATLENLECHVSTLNPGLTSHPPHRHPQEEFILIQEGTVEVHLNGTAQRASAGELLFFAANDLHNLTNVGDTRATYLVFQLTTAATHAVPPEGALAAARPGMLASGVYRWDKAAVEAAKTGERRPVCDSPTLTLTHFACHETILNPGEAPHASHHHPDEEIVAVIEGSLQVEFNGVVQRAGPDSIIFFGSNDEHGMKNVGTTPAAYYLFRIATAATPK
jgi:quercetin dioxygenase-like cupin family protein